MTFGSVCSGIEAASVAWTPLGWRCAFVSEIEPFPCALLKHYYPEVPNYGDMLKFNEWPARAIDVLVGGTPCQSFSIAGLRKGLADPRGNLTLGFLGVVERYRPKWLVWENVPGVHSSWSDAKASAPSEESRVLLEANGLAPGDFEEVEQTSDFDSFIAGLVELGYGVATRVLDAQFAGLAQRRERVFVVGYSGGCWQRAAAVLFDAPRLQWNYPPRRQAGQRVAPTVEGRAGRSGANNFATSGGLAETARSIRAQSQSSHREDSETFVPVIANTIRSGSDSPACHGKVNGTDRMPLIAHSVTSSGFDASEDGTGLGTPLIAFSCKDDGRDAQQNIAPTARSMNHSESHANAGGQLAIAFTDMRGENRSSGVQLTGDIANTVHCAKGQSEQQCIAFTERTRTDGRNFEAQDELAYAVTNPGSGGRTHSHQIAHGMAVRRLTPREVERLQGFPDDFTLIPYRGKPACDGPRYRALGNSMAVPVMHWLGRRIEIVESLATSRQGGEP